MADDVPCFDLSNYLIAKLKVVRLNAKNRHRNLTEQVSSGVLSITVAVSRFFNEATVLRSDFDSIAKQGRAAIIVWLAPCYSDLIIFVRSNYRCDLVGSPRGHKLQLFGEGAPSLRVHGSVPEAVSLTFLNL